MKTLAPPSRHPAFMAALTNSTRMSTLFILLAGGLSALASILLRVAALDGVAIPGGQWTMRLLAICAYGAGFVLYALALKRLELSMAYPLMVGTTMMLLFLYGLFSGEAVTAKTAAGAAMLVLGVCLIYA